MKRPRLLLFVLLILALLALAGAAGFYLLLPSYLEQRFLPGLAARLGVAEVRGRVCRLGLSGAELLDLTAGAPGEPALFIRTASLEYTISGLLRGRLAGVEIGGLRLRLDYRDGTLAVPGLYWPPPGAEEGKGGLELPVGTVAIKDGELLLASGQQPFRLPFALKARQEGQKIMGEVQLFPDNQQLFLQVQADPATGEAVGSFRTEGFAAARLAALPVLPPDWHPGGTIDLRGSIRLDLASLAVAHFTAEGSWRQAMLRINDVGFRALPGKDQPLVFAASGTPARWHLGLADFSLAAPRPLEVPALDVDVVLAEDRFEGAGRFRLQLPAAPGGVVTILAPFAAAGEIAGAYTPGGAWHFKLAAGPEEGAGGTRFRFNDVELACRPESLVLSGKGWDDEGELLLEAAFSDLEGKAVAAGFRAPEAALAGRVKTEKMTAVSDGNFALDVTELRVETGETAGTFGRAAWRGDIDAAGERVQLRSVLQLADSSVSFPEMKLQARGIAAELPFTWPPPASGRQGNVTVADLLWAEKSLGPVTAALRQQGPAYRFDVIHTVRLLDDLQALLAGTASWLEKGVGVQAKLTVPSHELKAVSLKRLHPAGAGLVLGGSLEAAGSFALDSEGTRGTLTAVLSRGILEHPENGWRVEGIETAFTMSDLLQLQSAPGQRLEFAKAAFGRLLFGPGRLGFQLEEPGSLLLEESEFAWSGGHLRLYGLRLAPGKEEHELVLYCDGVRVPDILAQLGVAEVQGEGAVSGRIPLTIRKGMLRFGEGFLASTPGRGGFLKVKDSGRLAAVIPEAARAGQIDFAMEALRNFEYDWVKLYFGSKGQDLIIQMQLDGKPAEPLPFTFDRELGSFVRLQGEGRAGIVQPIRLDINFRLPLDDLLHYGAGFQQLFEN